MIHFASAHQLQNLEEPPDDDWYSFFLSALAVRHGAFPRAAAPNGQTLPLQTVNDPLHPFGDCPVQAARSVRPRDRSRV